MGYELIILLILASGIFLLHKIFYRVTVYEYERGLKYEKGRFTTLLDAGVYWYNSYNVVINKIDIRPRYVTIPSQEVLSTDGVAIKLSLVANLEVVEPVIAVNSINDYEEAFYLIVQLALRTVISTTEIDKLLEKKQEFSKEVLELAKKQTKDLGLKLISIDVKDVTFPGSLKQTFSQVVKARHEGLAALERARGETAALRNLSNAAKILENNPALMQLRTIQSINESSGNTLVLNLSQGNLTPMQSSKEAETGSQ